MPLSEREQQILQDIERNLYEQEPSAAASQADLIRNVKRGAAGFLAGFAILVAFFIRPLLPVGVVAFLLMLASATYVFNNLKRASAGQIQSLRERAPLTHLLAGLEDKIKQIRERQDP